MLGKHLPGAGTPCETRRGRTLRGARVACAKPGVPLHGAINGAHGVAPSVGAFYKVSRRGAFFCKAPFSGCAGVQWYPHAVRCAIVEAKKHRAGPEKFDALQLAL